MFARLNKTDGIPLRFANRHALITGPTGTGKTISVMRLIESFASQGVSVICPDAKGDLSALARSCSVQHLQPLRGPGLPCRVPVWALGADLLSRALELTEAQAGALEIAFAFADETGQPLDTLGEFRASLARLAASPDSVAHLGHVTRASVGTIQRALLRLESQGAADMFGAPGYDVATAMQPGLVSIVDVSRLYHSPRLYGALMLYLLRDLARRLPELGDMDKPRLCLVIDESHCLFHEASPALLRSIEATARLIRSKGVGLYFASQSPDDIPAIVREQCATTIAHSRDLGVGRAAFRTLDAAGNATESRIIQPTLPACPLGPLSPEELARHVSQPVPVASPEGQPDAPQAGPQQDMTAHGYAFITFVALALCTAIYGASAAYAAWGLGGCVAIGFASWLAIRKRI